MSDFILLKWRAQQALNTLLKWRAQQALNTSLSVGGVGACMHGCMSGGNHVTRKWLNVCIMAAADSSCHML